jgi:hypothetical protein
MGRPVDVEQRLGEQDRVAGGDRERLGDRQRSLRPLVRDGLDQHPALVDFLRRPGSGVDDLERSGHLRQRDGGAVDPAQGADAGHPPEHPLVAEPRERLAQDRAAGAVSPQQVPLVGQLFPETPGVDVEANEVGEPASSVRPLVGPAGSRGAGWRPLASSGFRVAKRDVTYGATHRAAA